MHTYDAFISYCHAKDRPLASALQSVIQKLGKPWYRRRALRVFRDDTSLSATPSLWPTIEQALGQSRFFVLLASPEAAASKWVNKEVAQWLDNYSIDTLLIGVTDGDLSWNETSGDFAACGNMPLPPALAGRFATEPKWVDLRSYREGAAMGDAKFTELCADFAAAIHGTPKEDLLSQEVRQQRRALTLAWSATASLLLLAGAASWELAAALKAEREAINQKQEAEQQRAIADEQRGLAVNQRDKALLAQSRLLAQRAQLSQRDNDSGTAVLLSIEALTNDPGIDRPYVPEAEAALFKAWQAFQESFVVELHTELVASAVFSRDDRLLLTASEDKTVCVWEVDTGKTMIRYRGHNGHVYKAAFSPDGRFVVTASADQTAHIFDAQTGLTSTILKGHLAPVWSAAFSPDGRRVVTASGDKTARIWDAATGRNILVLSGHTDAVKDAVFSPDGRWIATASSDKTARIWNAETGRLQAVLSDHKNGGDAPSFVENGEAVAAIDNATRL
jgi:WD40 repeat protein